MVAAAQPVTVSRDRAGAWLYGRWTDLFLGCGLAYLLSLPVLFAVGAFTGASGWPESSVVLFALLINGPHYGATILRVYESRADRRKYAVFALYITLVILGLFAVASRNVLLASVLITAYLTWSPWHFSGQNYGLSLMFLRRRGFDVNPVTKRWIYASFVLSAALAILAIHGGRESMVFAPNTIRVAHAPTILALKLPAAIVTPLRAGFFLAYLGCLVAAGWRLTRSGALRDLAPALLLVITQAMWFTVPALLGSAGSGALLFSALWVSVWHSIQYLWVTAYYAKASESRSTFQLFLVKALVAGTAVQAIPGVLMSPQWFGTLPWDAGLAATLFAVVNLHHFVLDGAIWKLRDGRVARVLLRAPEPADAGAALPDRRRPWAHALVWGVACLGLLVPLGQAFGRSALEGPPQPGSIERPLQILRWVGRETTRVHYRIGTLYARQGQHAEAVSHFQRSIALFPTAYAWFALGSEYKAMGRWEPAQGAFEKAIDLDPNVAEAHFARAEALLVLARARADVTAREEAAASLERALELRPGHPRAALALAQIQLDEGDVEQAIRTLERALAAGEPAGADAIRNALARLRS